MRPILASVVSSSLALMLVAGCSANGGSSSSRGGGGVGGGGVGGAGGSGGLVLDAGGSDSSTYDPDAACQEIGSEGQPVPAALLLLLDYSWSMCLAPNVLSSITCAADPAKSRWGVLATALEGAIPLLPTDAYTALAYYPSDLVTGSCVTPASPQVPIALNDGAHQGALVGALPPVLGDNSPVLQTPTAGALAGAYAYLKSASGTSIPAEAARFVVLVTDGNPNCGGSAATVTAAVTQAFGEGTRTFVVGIPGASSFNVGMSQAAAAGGTGKAGCQPGGPNYCHFDLTKAADPAALAASLADALATIKGQAASCDYQIPDDPSGTFDRNRVNVRYTHGDGTVDDLEYDAACTGTGWRYDDPNAPKRILMCPGTCAVISADTGPAVKILFGCPTHVH